MTRTITVRECVDCGARSVPFFGFSSPCRASRGGGHGETVPVDVDRDTVASQLYATWCNVPGFDRAHFDDGASTEQRRLLRHGEQLETSA